MKIKSLECNWLKKSSCHLVGGLPLNLNNVYNGNVIMKDIAMPQSNPDVIGVIYGKIIIGNTNVYLFCNYKPASELELM